VPSQPDERVFAIPIAPAVATSAIASVALVKAMLTPAFVLARVWADRDGVTGT
jgi:hypothetical protein